MSGSMIAVVLLGAMGLARPMPRPLADAAMLVSGASMGAGITPEVSVPRGVDTARGVTVALSTLAAKVR